jgi:hypothetical protein
VTFFSSLRRIRANSLWLAWFVLHFFIILVVAWHEVYWLARQGFTLLPRLVENESEESSPFIEKAWRTDPAGSNPLRQALTTYAAIAGIDAGYGYFAPNVPGTYRLTFELRYPDGKVERMLPRVHSRAAALRLAGLLDEIGRTHSDSLREHIIRMLAQSIWRTHPEVRAMRAVLEEINLPSVREFERGKGESAEFLYSYDLSVVMQ